MLNEQLITELFSEDCNVIFAAVYGSYARNEAAYLVDKDGKSNLYNDFDMVLVVRDKKLFAKRFLKYKERMSDIVGGCDVDFLVIDKPISRKVKSSIWYKDFCHCTRILLGGETEMEHYFGSSITYDVAVFDVYALFITRSWTAGSLSSKLTKEPFNEIYKGYQAAKLVIAIVDIFLLMHSKYETLLKDKLKALRYIDGEFATMLAEKLILAIEVKMSPSKDIFSKAIQDEGYVENLIDSYNHVFSAYLKSNLFACDLMLSIYMNVRYLKFLVLNRDRTVSEKLKLRHKQARVVRAYERKRNINDFNSQMAAILIRHESL